MTLRIDAPETMRLLEERSRRTGESPESAVEAALRERLNRLRVADKGAQRWAELHALLNGLASLETFFTCAGRGATPVGSPGSLREARCEDTPLRKVRSGASRVV